VINSDGRVNHKYVSARPDLRLYTKAFTTRAILEFGVMCWHVLSPAAPLEASQNIAPARFQEGVQSQGMCVGLSTIASDAQPSTSFRFDSCVRFEKLE
jgi:hypothetical protein